MRWLVLLALVLAGCSSPGQGVAFVVNRTGQAAGQGKSYSFPVAVLEQVLPPGSTRERSSPEQVLPPEAGSVELSAGQDVRLQVANVTLPPAEWVGRNFSISGGRLRLEGREVSVRSGQLSLQTLQDGTYRGNFNAQLGDGLEAVGYFEARLKQP